MTTHVHLPDGFQGAFPAVCAHHVPNIEAAITQEPKWRTGNADALFAAAHDELASLLISCPRVKSSGTEVVGNTRIVFATSAAYGRFEVRFPPTEDEWLDGWRTLLAARFVAAMAPV